MYEFEERARPDLLERSRHWQEGHMEELVVKHIMTRSVVTCNPDMTLTEVTQLLFRADVDAIIVVDANGDLQGLISRLDVLGHFGQDLGSQSAGHAMAKDIPSISPDDTIQSAVQQMLRLRVDGLVVVNAEKTRALGIISTSDVVQAMLARE
jgi:CBS domain-containing protein